jgi:hypothetical protein
LLPGATGGAVHLGEAMGRLFAVFAGIFFTLAAAVSGAAPQLVIPVAEPATAKSSPQFRPGASAVRFNEQELFALPAGAAVELTLPDATRQAYTFEHSIDHGGGIRTWIARGALKGDGERAVITTGPGGTWGWMKTADNEWRIYPGTGNDWLMARPPMDYAPQFRGGDAIAAPEDDLRVGPLKGIPTAVPNWGPKSLTTAKATPPDAKRVDVMIIYTKDLADKLGGGLLPMLYNLVASANQAYVDSEVALSLRLVNATLLDYPNANGSSATLGSMAGGGAFASIFEPLTWGAGSLREQLGADMVALVRDGPNDTGGIAYLLRNSTVYPTVNPVATAAFSVNNYCAGGCEGIFAHELGHNMGNSHDPATQAYDNAGTFNAAGGTFTFSFGHYDCANGLTCDPFTPGSGCNDGINPLPARPRCATGANPTANDFGTIMSYFGPGVMKFSNPGIFCKPNTTGATDPGRACGTADRNNALSMNNVRQNVSAYRNQVIAELAGSVQFKQTSFSAPETGGSVTFTATRVGGSAGALSVNYAVTGATATAGVDFVQASGTLTWAAGDAADKTFTVTLRDEQAVEGIETLTATLSNVVGSTGAYLGHPTTATGVILEAWPPGGTFPAGFTNTSGNPWAIASDQNYDGDAVSLKSGAIQFGTNNCDTSGNPASPGTRPCPSSVQFSDTFAAGEMSFAYRVDSYPSFGFFEFLLDGVVVASASGRPASVTDDPARPGWRTFKRALTAGAHTLVWRYRPGLTFPCSNAIPGGATSPPYPDCADRAWIDAVSLPLPLTASTVAVASSLNPAPTGQPVTFTATVTASGAPTGTVAFLDGGNVIGGCGARAITSSTATCATSSLPAGTRTITAAYSGTTTQAASLSAPLTQTIVASQTLTVTKAGTGGGTVTSSPAGIDCGATCSASFGAGAAVTLSATASAGSIFAGWSGGGCAGTGSCTVTLDAATTVTATFNTAPAGTFALTVGKAGAGTGTVTSSPVGIDCGAVCVFSFSANASVTLTAAASAGSAFTGWSGGGCSGTGTCVVTMDAAKTVTATFASTQVALTVTKAGGGSGTVTSSPAGIDCGATCTGNFNTGASVTLTATPAAGSFLSGWTGACTGTGTCQVTMDAAKSVTATFALNTTIPRLANISTRGPVFTGNDVMIGGFVIGGAVAKKVLITARGPSLAAFGVSGAMANPKLEIYSGQTKVFENDDWQTQSAAAGGTASVAAIQGTGIAPSSPLEAALMLTLNPGAYTAVVSGVNFGTGVGIVEVFEQDKPEVPLTNISTRGQVQTVDNVMIGGFIIQGDKPQTVLITARGPSLAPFGITNPLPNPKLEIYSGQAKIFENDDWETNANKADIAATGVAPSDPKESALLVTLNPGAYTAVVSGVGGVTGVGIVEVFAR